MNSDAENGHWGYNLVEGVVEIWAKLLKLKIMSTNCEQRKLEGKILWKLEIWEYKLWKWKVVVQNS